MDTQPDQTDQQCLRAWHRIWSGKTVSPHKGELLPALIAADGFDTGFGSYSVEDWLQIVRQAASLTGTSAHSTVLEIGCGAGAFLYALHQETGCTVYGTDYSPSLVESAKKCLPFCHVAQTEATAIPFDVPFDTIFSNGVFFYFPDLKYAEEVLKAAFHQLKSGGKLCITELNDARCEQEYHQARQQFFQSPQEYADHYAGLDHLFFDKEELRRMLTAIGFTTVSFFDHPVSDCVNARFRFNVLAQKPL